MAQGTVRIKFLNNTGGGFSGFENVADGTTVGEFFRSKMGNVNEADYTIRNNRMGAVRSDILKEGDFVSITPRKIHGAALEPAACDQIAAMTEHAFLSSIAPAAPAQPVAA